MSIGRVIVYGEPGALSVSLYDERFMAPKKVGEFRPTAGMAIYVADLIAAVTNNPKTPPEIFVMSQATYGALKDAGVQNLHLA